MKRRKKNFSSRVYHAMSSRVNNRRKDAHLYSELMYVYIINSLLEHDCINRHRSDRTIIWNCTKKNNIFIIKYRNSTNSHFLVGQNLSRDKYFLSKGRPFLIKIWLIRKYKRDKNTASYQNNLGNRCDQNLKKVSKFMNFIKCKLKIEIFFHVYGKATSTR